MPVQETLYEGITGILDLIDIKAGNPPDHQVGNATLDCPDFRICTLAIEEKPGMLLSYLSDKLFFSFSFFSMVE